MIVAVANGEPVGRITAQLAAEGVIDSTEAMRAYMFFHGTPTVQAGDYELYAHEPFARVLATLSSVPDVFEIDVTPGTTVGLVAAEVDSLPGHSAAAFLAAVRTDPALTGFVPAGTPAGSAPGEAAAGFAQGLLGTGMYQVMPHETDAALAHQMVARFLAVAAGSRLAAVARAYGLSAYDEVVVASLVQEEGVYRMNMSKVARVVYNRLARGMALQMDSTVLYAEGRDSGKVTSGDLQVDSPFNTYLHSGLPPTPIAVPSPEAIDAALHPTPGSWLYFVLVSKSGREAFATTYAQQVANEKLAMKNGAY